MLILVDGYNVTMRDPMLAGRDKEAQRDALVERLRRTVRVLHGRGAQTVVVFDAHGSWGRTTEALGSVKAVYADVADDEIVRRCAETRGNVVVYTDDMRLRARISQDVGRRVEYRDVSALFVGSEQSLARPGTSKNVRDGRQIEDGLPPDAGAITAELAEQWLDDEEE